MMRSCSLHSRTSSLLSLCGIAVLLALNLSCSSESGSGTGIPEGTGGSAPENSPECTNTPPCEGAEVDKNGNQAVCVQTVDADVVDENGSPVANFHAQVCGSNVCKSGKSDAAGHLHFVACKNMVEPAFDIPGQSKYVTVAVPVTLSVSSLGLFKLAPLSTGAAQLKSSPSQDATYSSGGAILVVPAGGEVEINEIDHPETDDQMFRASRLDPAQAPGLAASSPKLELFYGLAPTGTKLSKPASLTLPNWNKWSAGAAVEFFVQGAEGTLAAGKWTSMGTGNVSDDGKTISTSTEGGITVIGLIGVRRK